MEPLRCDLCNGTLVIDDSREFATCEFCGTKYMASTLRAKIQEIRGTVSVEGAVETTTGVAEKERLIKNVETFIKIGRYNEAEETVKIITNQFPEDYRGWWIKFIIPFERLGGKPQIDDFITASKLCPNKDIIINYFDKYFELHGNKLQTYKEEVSFYDLELNRHREEKEIIIPFIEWLICDTEKYLSVLPESFNKLVENLTKLYIEGINRGIIFPKYIRPLNYKGKIVYLKDILKKTKIKVKIHRQEYSSPYYDLIYKDKFLQNNGEKASLQGCWLHVGYYDDDSWILLPNEMT